MFILVLSLDFTAKSAFDSVLLPLMGIGGGGGAVILPVKE